MSIQATFYFNNGNAVTSSEIVLSGFQLTQVYYNTLKSADGSLSFSIPFNNTISNYLKADINNDVKVEIKDGNTYYFTGYLQKNVQFLKTQRNQDIKLTAVNPSYFLDVSVGEYIGFKGKTVAYIVKNLLNRAGFIDAEIGTIDVTDEVTFMSCESSASIKSLLKELLFEYRRCFYFDEKGKFQVHTILDIPSSYTQTFDGTNIRNQISITAKEHSGDYVRGTWTPIEFKENTLLFEDTQNGTDEDDCSIEIEAESWCFGEEHNLLNCDSTLGTVLYVDAVTTKNVEADDGIIWYVDLQNRESADQIHFKAYNENEESAYITKLQIYGDAYIQTETCVEATTTGKKNIDFTFDYLNDKTKVQELVEDLANYYNYANFDIQFQSSVNYALGSFVKVSEYGMGTFNGRIIKKVYNLQNDLITYTVETIGTFTPSVITSSKNTSSVKNATVSKGKKGDKGDTGTARVLASLSAVGYENEVAIYNGRVYICQNGNWVVQSTDNYLGIYNTTLPVFQTGNYFLCGNDFEVANMIVNTSKKGWMTDNNSKVFRAKRTFKKGEIYQFTQTSLKRITDHNDYRYMVAALDSLTTTGSLPPVLQTSIENTAAEKVSEITQTGNYLGLRLADPSIEEEVNTGDYYLYNGTTTSSRKKGYIYRYNGTTWSILDPTNSDNYYQYMTSLSDALAITDASTGAFGTLFCNVLMANTAIIQTLQTKVITLQGNGVVQSANFSDTSSNKAGFKLQGSNGSAVLNGDVKVGGSLTVNGTGTFGSGCTFKGNLSGATGTFSGNLSGAGGSFTGSLSGASITGATGNFSGTLSGASITGATGTFSGALSAATGSFAGSLSGANGTFNGDVTVGDYDGSEGKGAKIYTASDGTGKIETALLKVSQLTGWLTDTYGKNYLNLSAARVNLFGIMTQSHLERINYTGGNASSLDAAITVMGRNLFHNWLKTCGKISFRVQSNIQTEEIIAISALASSNSSFTMYTDKAYLTASYSSSSARYTINTYEGSSVNYEITYFNLVW